MITLDGNISLYERAEKRRQLMSELRQSKPRDKVLVSGLNLDYYDKCLVKMLENIDKRGMSPEETCWHRYAQTNKCVGVSANGNFDNFLEEMKALGKAYFNKEELFVEDGFIYFRNTSNSVLATVQLVDHELQLYRQIKKKWKDGLSRKYPIILGHSGKTDKHHLISGRHRVACLVYLNSQRLLKSKNQFSCHYISYPYDKIVYTRPYYDICRKCRWGEHIEVGEGTHQHFTVCNGAMVIHSNEAKDKWGLIQPIFDEVVKGKSVLDIGAYKGLYCLKAMEHGAKSATALESSPILSDSIKRLCYDVVEENINVIESDFYQCEIKPHDSVIALGVIHHLLRQGIQSNILTTYDELLGRISKMGNNLIVEFAEPKEDTKQLPVFKPYRLEFTLEKFLSSLGKYYRQVKLLGKCSYRENRLIYLAQNT